MRFRRSIRRVKRSGPKLKWARTCFDAGFTEPTLSTIPEACTESDCARIEGGVILADPTAFVPQATVTNDELVTVHQVRLNYWRWLELSAAPVTFGCTVTFFNAVIRGPADPNVIVNGADFGLVFSGGLDVLDFWMDSYHFGVAQRVPSQDVAGGVGRDLSRIIKSKRRLDQTENLTWIFGASRSDDNGFAVNPQLDCCTAGAISVLWRETQRR